MDPEVNKYDSTEELFKKTAGRIVTLINDFNDKYGRCTFVLAGGNTPKALYDTISINHKTDVDWDKVFFFWGDERCVLPDDENSNYKMAYDHLLSGLKIKDEKIFRIHGEHPPGIAASEYENTIKDFFRSIMPSFDIILLGVGTDGHTASIFPGSRLLNNNGSLAEEDYSENTETWRVTLTLPVINNSKNIIFLASGISKSEIIREILTNNNSPLPAKKVKPHNGALTWFIDKEAGSLI